MDKSSFFMEQTTISTGPWLPVRYVLTSPEGSPSPWQTSPGAGDVDLRSYSLQQGYYTRLSKASSKVGIPPDATTLGILKAE